MGFFRFCFLKSKNNYFTSCFKKLYKLHLDASMLIAALEGLL